jgi:gluconolactonase
MFKFYKILLLLFPVSVFGQNAPGKYIIDSASVEHPGVPKGEVLKYTLDGSKIFPGTNRDYWVYIPAEYKQDQPACVYINQDGLGWDAPIVFDNLIYNREMPVTIGIFVNPGQVIAGNTQTDNNRFNRSFEYDGLGDNYARFILEELLPEVEKQKASDGRAIHLSKNGNDRAIGGLSSGAVCAFTAAWEKPNQFSRVFSAIGTYVGLRGAERYPTLIRKFEPKPIRIFLQDGTHDLNIYGGDWWKANETMERALIFAGYEVNHVWGEDGHNGNQGKSIFPQAMRWLWKDWPKPVSAGSSTNQFLNRILMPGQDWELVGEGYGFAEGTAANASGEVYYQDIPNSKTYKIGLDGKLKVLAIDAKKASGTSFGPDGKRYTAAGGTNQILCYDTNERVKTIADHIAGNDLVVAKNGNIYVTEPDGVQNPSKIYLFRPNGEKKLVDQGLKFANGIALTPDQTQLYITESASHWVWIYKIEADGSLSYKQRFGWLHSPDNEDNAWPDGLRCDIDGRVYVSSRIGIQVLDQLGRVNAILPSPGGQISNCCFGGANFDTLYISCGDKVYRRKLNVRGANNFDNPVKPPKPQL